MLKFDSSTSAEMRNQSMFSAEEIRRSRLNTEAQLMTGDDLLRMVVEDSHLADSIGSTHQTLQVREEAALRQLQNDLAVKVIGNSNVIEASYGSSSPERAADVLRRVYDAYLRSHRAAAQGRDVGQLSQYPFPAQPPLSVATANGSDLRHHLISSKMLRLQARALDHQQRTAEAHRNAQWFAQHTPSDLVILQEPSTPQLPNSPRRGFLLVMALLGSLSIGVAAAFCLELLSGRLQDSTAIAQLTGVPLLASIPRDAVAPPFADAFPALYLAMQRPRVTFLGRLS